MVRAGGLAALAWLAATGMATASEATLMINNIAPIELRLDRLASDPVTDPAKRFGAWSSGNGTTQRSVEPGLGSDQRMVSIGAGLDYRITDDIVFGLGIIHDDTDLQRADFVGRVQRDGWTLAPYLAWSLGPHVTLSATAGWAALDNEQFSVIAGKGQYDTHAWHVGAGIGFNYPLGDWRFGAAVRYLHVHERDEAYSFSDGTQLASSKRTIAQGRAMVTIGYDFGGFTPFLTGGIEHEFKTLQSFAVAATGLTPDRDGFIVGGGFNFALSPFRGSLRYLSEEGRRAGRVPSLPGPAKRLEFSLELPF